MAGYLLSKLNPRYLFQYIGQHIPIRGAESDASDGYESSIKAHEQLRSCAFRYSIALVGSSLSAIVILPVAVVEAGGEKGEGSDAQ